LNYASFEQDPVQRIAGNLRPRSGWAFEPVRIAVKIGCAHRFGIPSFYKFPQHPSDDALKEKVLVLALPFFPTYLTFARIKAGIPPPWVLVEKP
jgi:hypothetical protein